MRPSPISCIISKKPVREVTLSLLRNRRILRFLCASLLIAGAGSAMADVLVLRAAGPSARSFPPGRRLPDNARLVLKTNDELIVLDGRGTRTIRGPGTFIAGVASNAPAQLASAAAANGRRARIGAVRGIETGPLRPTTIWHVDVSKSSNVCVPPPNKVALWRADSSADATLTAS